jgi:rhamnogalacturonan endolyase
MRRINLATISAIWLCCVSSAAFAQAHASAPVTITDNPTTVTLSNGIVSVTFWKKGAHFPPSTSAQLPPPPMPPDATQPTNYPDPTAPNGRPPSGRPGGAQGGPPPPGPMRGPSGPRNGEGASILYTVNGKTTEMSDGRRAIYFDSGGDRIYPVQDGDMQIVTNTPDRAEIMWAGAPTTGGFNFNFDTEFHVIMLRGVSGYYLYAVYKHPADLPAANVGETRFVLYGPPAQTLFTNHIVDDIRQGDPPQGPWVRKVQDTTWQWPDGTIYTKYNYSAFLADHHLHGLVGHGLGEWMITPSNEYVGGGPYKQDLMVHADNTLLSMFVGGHYGANGIRVAAGENWDKIFGPVFLYYNHSELSDPQRNKAALWADAKKQAAAQLALWPYKWVARDDYPLARGTVSGQIKLADGTSTRGAWAMLVPPDDDWEANIKGYDFWSPVDATGHFKIGKVRPGTYALVVAGADQFEPFRKENVVVTAAASDLGTIIWTPVTHGTYLWQIGYADRSTAEFKHGDDARHWENFAYYITDFPNDVNYTIGKSDFAKDWNYAQWTLYNKQPYWSIHFNLPKALTGQATLTIGMAASSGSTLLVSVNGQSVSSLPMPKTGTAFYRSGNQDSQYHVCLVTFDAALLVAGDNEIRLAASDAKPFPAGVDALTIGAPGGFMYDAIRLEVDSPDAKPLMRRVPPPAMAAPYNPGPHPTPGLKSAPIP